VSLLLQAEQKAMKISRRTDPNLYLIRSARLMQDALICPSLNPLLPILHDLLLRDRFRLVLLTLKNDVYDAKYASYAKI
jgi:hypothetical protein